MANLKDLKNRISSVKNTQKITKAMKMVAAAKLRKAQEAAIASRPYSEKLAEVMTELAGAKDLSGSRNLLTGTGEDKKHLVIVATSSRGLCGGFNSSITKAASNKIYSLIAREREVEIICVGSKGEDLLRAKYGDLISETIVGKQKKTVEFSAAKEIADKIAAKFEAGEFDECSIFYNHFNSPISQVPTMHKLVPCGLPETEEENDNENSGTERADDFVFEFEPEKEQILDYLLPKNLAIQIYHALLENQASEMGARMTAMDNATRNAGDMIERLSLEYNRTRQAAITTELIEIISGAEAL